MFDLLCPQVPRFQQCWPDAGLDEPAAPAGPVESVGQPNGFRDGGPGHVWWWAGWRGDLPDCRRWTDEQPKGFGADATG